MLERSSNAWTERLARAATVEMGGSALLAFYSMSGAVAKKAVVRGTLSLCAQLGETLREARAAHGDPVEAIAELLDAKVIFHGRVRRHRAAHGRRVRPRQAQFEGVEEWEGAQFRLRVPERVPDGRTRRQDPRHDARPHHLLDAESGESGDRRLAALWPPRQGAGVSMCAGLANPAWARARGSEIFRVRSRLHPIQSGMGDLSGAVVRQSLLSY